MRTFIYMAALAALPVWAQQPGSSANTPAPVIRANATEIMLDVVVRDRKGKDIRDLAPADFEVQDNGARQTLRSVRLISGTSEIDGGATKPLPALQQVRLVTLLFEQLSVDGRRLARQACLDLIKAQQPVPVLYAVMSIDQQLSLLAPFTSDREQLKKAIELATSGEYAKYVEVSEHLKGELKASLTATDPVKAMLARTSLGMLSFASGSSKDSSFVSGGDSALAGRASIFGLMSVAGGQEAVPGRKAVVYFSEGLRIPINLTEQFDAIVSLANRANVALYAVDARGLQTATENGGAMSELQNAANASRQQAQQTSGPVSIAEIRAQDVGEQSMLANTETTLLRLGQGTGGALIANTNDLRTPLRRMEEDLNTYYELTYDPGITNYDGQFRKISVKVARNDARVTARSGYLALAPSQTGMAAAVLPYEAPLIAALATLPPPRNLEFHSAALHFHPGKDSTTAAVVIEVPLKDLKVEQAADHYQARLSMLALLKNAKGEVVQKFTRDLPIQVTQDKLAALQAGNFTYKQFFTVTPGRYTLETAVRDGESGSIGARKAAFVVVPQHPGVMMSDISLVRRYDAGAKDLEPGDPFQYNGGRITPTLTSEIKGGKGSALSMFMVIYPDASIAEKPQLILEYQLDGQVVGRGAVELPPADAAGRIPFVMSSSAEGMKPGQYEIRAVVKQGASAAEQRAFLTVEP